MATLADLYPYIRPYAEQCPLAIIQNEARNALIEFCERTLYWRDTLAPISAVAAQAIYPVTPTDQAATRCIAIINAMHNDYPMTGMAEDQIDLEWPKLNYTWALYFHESETSTPWRTLTRTQAWLYFQPDPLNIRLVPIPEVSGTDNIQIEIAIKPMPTATAFSDHIFNDFFQTIAHGALARLFAQPQKEWSNAELANFYLGAFNSGVQIAAAKASNKYVRQDEPVGRTRAYK